MAAKSKGRTLQRACVYCASCKRRCGPERPCARCTRLGLECMTLPDGRRRGAQAGLSLAKQIAKQRTSYQPPAPPRAGIDDALIMVDSTAGMRNPYEQQHQQIIGSSSGMFSWGNVGPDAQNVLGSREQAPPQFRSGFGGPASVHPAKVRMTSDGRPVWIQEAAAFVTPAYGVGSGSTGYRPNRGPALGGAPATSGKAHSYSATSSSQGSLAHRNMQYAQSFKKVGRSEHALGSGVQNAQQMISEESLYNGSFRTNMRFHGPSNNVESIQQAHQTREGVLVHPGEKRRRCEQTAVYKVGATGMAHADERIRLGSFSGRAPQEDTVDSQLPGSAKLDKMMPSAGAADAVSAWNPSPLPPPTVRSQTAFGPTLTLTSSDLHRNQGGQSELNEIALIIRSLPNRQGVRAAVGNAVANPQSDSTARIQRLAMDVTTPFLDASNKYAQMTRIEGSRISIKAGTCHKQLLPHAARALAAACSALVHHYLAADADAERPWNASGLLTEPSLPMPAEYLQDSTSSVTTAFATSAVGILEHRHDATQLDGMGTKRRSEIADQGGSSRAAADASRSDQGGEPDDEKPMLGSRGLGTASPHPDPSSGRREPEKPSCNSTLSVAAVAKPQDASESSMQFVGSNMTGAHSAGAGAGRDDDPEEPASPAASASAGRRSPDLRVPVNGDVSGPTSPAATHMPPQLPSCVIVAHDTDRQDSTRPVIESTENSEARATHSRDQNPDGGALTNEASLQRHLAAFLDGCQWAGRMSISRRYADGRESVLWSSSTTNRGSRADSCASEVNGADTKTEITNAEPESKQQSRPSGSTIEPWSSSRPLPSQHKALQLAILCRRTVALSLGVPVPPHRAGSVGSTAAAPMEAGTTQKTAGGLTEMGYAAHKGSGSKTPSTQNVDARVDLIEFPIYEKRANLYRNLSRAKAAAARLEAGLRYPICSVSGARARDEAGAEDSNSGISTSSSSSPPPGGISDGCIAVFRAEFPAGTLVHDIFAKYQALYLSATSGSAEQKSKSRGFAQPSGSPRGSDSIGPESGTASDSQLVFLAEVYHALRTNEPRDAKIAGIGALPLCGRFDPIIVLGSDNMPRELEAEAVDSGELQTKGSAAGQLRTESLSKDGATGAISQAYAEDERQRNLVLRARRSAIREVLAAHDVGTEQGQVRMQPIPQAAPPSRSEDDRDTTMQARDRSLSYDAPSVVDGDGAPCVQAQATVSPSSALGMREHISGGISLGNSATSSTQPQSSTVVTVETSEPPAQVFLPGAMIPSSAMTRSSTAPTFPRDSISSSSSAGCHTEAPGVLRETKSHPTSPLHGGCIHRQQQQQQQHHRQQVWQQQQWQHQQQQHQHQQWMLNLRRQQQLMHEQQMLLGYPYLQSPQSMPSYHMSGGHAWLGARAGNTHPPVPMASATTGWSSEAMRSPQRTPQMMAASGNRIPMHAYSQFAAGSHDGGAYHARALQQQQQQAQAYQKAPGFRAKAYSLVKEQPHGASRPTTLSRPDGLVPRWHAPQGTGMQSAPTSRLQALTSASRGQGPTSSSLGSPRDSGTTAVRQVAKPSSVDFHKGSLEGTEAAVAGLLTMKLAGVRAARAVQ